MTAMREIEWEASLLEPRPWPEFEKRLTHECGRPGGLMRYLEGNEWLGDATIRLSVELANRVHLDADLADEVGLVVSQDNSCRFCFGAQRMLLRSLGMKEARIAQLEQDLLTGDFTPRERAALKFTRRISRSAPLATMSDIDALREVGFSNDEIAELVGVIGLHLYFNRLATLLALPPESMEELPDKWWARFGRPLMAIKCRSMRTTSRPTDLTPEERTGPFASVVNGLDGLPMARQLRIVLDGMWESNAISPRAVPLIFAVVARALGCVPSEQEATRLLMETGLSWDDVHDVLTHLSSPALSDVERAIVPLARETVWYDPAPIQRRCRDFGNLLSRKQVLELVGAVSIANAVCRLGVLTEHCA
jgi:AhpD family alkylhydroperoxidase